MDTGELSIRSEFHGLIVEFFKEDDMRQAAFDIGIEWENLAGETLSAKVRNMIIHLEDRGLLYRLVGYCQKKRPKIDWTGFG